MDKSLSPPGTGCVWTPSSPTLLSSSTPCPSCLPSPSHIKASSDCAPRLPLLPELPLGFHSNRKTVVGSKNAELQLVLGLGGGGETWASLEATEWGKGEHPGERWGDRSQVGSPLRRGGLGGPREADVTLLKKSEFRGRNRKRDRKSNAGFYI